ncbi:9416_t:CDS:2 [Funneliformis mosseae]|uniref:9416_t:CDS:1 n=1 Tax=Funneliformis mosseae TaxID=27381 RepID=A0A9N9DPN2_FUNMO|nr:9416_t:CDS:2 [Funneliformis mosseae]
MRESYGKTFTLLLDTTSKVVNFIPKALNDLSNYTINDTWIASNLPITVIEMRNLMRLAFLASEIVGSYLCLCIFISKSHRYLFTISLSELILVDIAVELIFQPDHLVKLIDKLFDTTRCGWLMWLPSIDELYDNLTSKITVDSSIKTTQLSSTGIQDLHLSNLTEGAYKLHPSFISFILIQQQVIKSEDRNLKSKFDLYILDSIKKYQIGLATFGVNEKVFPYLAFSYVIANNIELKNLIKLIQELLVSWSDPAAMHENINSNANQAIRTS